LIELLAIEVSQVLFVRRTLFVLVLEVFGMSVLIGLVMVREQWRILVGRSSLGRYLVAKEAIIQEGERILIICSS